MKTARCKSCRAEIIWAITENGKRIPLDAEPAERPTGVFTVVERGGETYAIPTSRDPVFITHFATCAFADQHRKSAA